MMGSAEAWFVTEEPPVLNTEEQLVHQFQQGDASALGELFDRNRDRLLRFVRFRMDKRLYGRIDAEDVLQEAYLAAAQRARHYQQDPTHSIFVWLRMIVQQTMVDLHRQHLGAQMRDAGREISLQPKRNLPATSVSMVLQLLGKFTSPSQIAMRAEMSAQLEQALETMNPIDREILALRHFEELTNNEVAEVLDIQPKAASIRYVRAIKRLKSILEELPGFNENPDR